MGTRAVIVNRRPILRELLGWIERAGATVVLLTARSAVVDAADLDALRARCTSVDVLEDYDAADVEHRIRDACVALGARALVSFTETDVIRCARIREHLGLEGQRLASAEAYRDKLVMKSLAARAGLAVAAMARADDAAALRALCAGGGGLVIKPRQGVASKGMRVVASPGELDAALAELGAPGDLLVERFVAGDLYHVDGLMLDGRLIQGWPSRQLHQPFATMYESRSNLSAMVHAGDPVLRPLVDAAAAVVAALPPAPGLLPLHAEFFVDDNHRITLCEIASRAGGAGIVEAYERSFGVSLYGAPLLHQLGVAADAACFAPSPARCHGWAWFPPRAGKLVRVPVACSLPGVVRFRALAHAGDTLSAPRALGDSVFEVIFEVDPRRPVLDQLRTFDAWWEAETRWA